MVHSMLWPFASLEEPDHMDGHVFVALISNDLVAIGVDTACRTNTNATAGRPNPFQRQYDLNGLDARKGIG